ncbi:unnamed protein product [Mesocestoides corti]|uniref:Secreted protein n=1 Tax=Mesocestoides corti TaxID=53468 RepID=A0A0R3U6P2_MESCO|nr:unnamed protein product [Mesocestoides corti]
MCFGRSGISGFVVGFFDFDLLSSEDEEEVDDADEEEEEVEEAEDDVSVEVEDVSSESLESSDSSSLLLPLLLLLLLVSSVDVVSLDEPDEVSEVLDVEVSELELSSSLSLLESTGTLRFSCGAVFSFILDILSIFLKKCKQKMGLLRCYWQTRNRTSQSWVLRMLRIPSPFNNLSTAQRVFLSSRRLRCLLPLLLTGAEL